MSLRITRACDHNVTSASEPRYCSTQDVLDEVNSVAVDDEGNALGGIFQKAERARLLAAYITAARLWVEKKAGHDFEQHDEVLVYLDGSGSDVLDLSPLGFVPLLDVTDLTIDGYPQTLDVDYGADRAGRLFRVSSTGAASGKAYSRGATFPWGRQNVSAKLSWGYTEYPSDIVRAQAMKVTADLLRNAQRSDGAGGTDLPGGVSSILFGSDLRVDMPARGRYADMIADLEKRATSICLGYALPKVRGAGVRRIGAR